MTVSDVIRQRIEANGPIPFRDFMDIALYYPGLGYYTSGKNRIGTEGDYFTSPTVTPIIGELLGKQIEEMWTLTGKGHFTVVEYGAGAGLLCNDILNMLLHSNKELYDQLSYVIIEKNTLARDIASISSHPNVSFCNSIKDLNISCGCVLSIELVDNFPVHLVVMEDALMEVFVDFREGEFQEVLRPAATPLTDYLNELGVELPQGFRAEINLDAIDWLKDVSNALQKGFVITIDYGLASEDLYSAQRSNGSLRCFYQHQVTSTPYLNVGDQDITAHVNFSALKHYGSRVGLACRSYCTQGEYLRSLGLVEQLRQMELSGRYQVSEMKQKLFMVHTLLMEMGPRFKVLVQQKGIDTQV